MIHKSTQNLDALIKKIYASYIDIKSGDFREIDKDILLSDIQSLYSSIKELYPNNLQEISEIERDIASQKDEKPIEISQIELNNIVATPPEESQPTKIDVQESVSTTEHQIDLTMFMDDEDISVVTESEKTEQSFNAQNPIVGDVIGKTEKASIKHFDQIPDLSQEETKSEMTQMKTETPVQEPEKKSQNKIMDFLHEGESVQKDIYSLLDINTRIGLIELFFKGNSIELTECLVKINKQTTKQECLDIVNKYAEHFQVKKEDDIYQTFCQLIDRKFQYL